MHRDTNATPAPLHQQQQAMHQKIYPLLPLRLNLIKFLYFYFSLIGFLWPIFRHGQLHARVIFFWTQLCLTPALPPWCSQYAKSLTIAISTFLFISFLPRFLFVFNCETSSFFPSRVFIFVNRFLLHYSFHRAVGETCQSKNMGLVCCFVGWLTDWLVGWLVRVNIWCGGVVEPDEKKEQAITEKLANILKMNVCR